MQPLISQTEERNSLHGRKVEIHGTHAHSCATLVSTLCSLAPLGCSSLTLWYVTCLVDWCLPGTVKSPVELRAKSSGRLPRGKSTSSVSSRSLLGFLVGSPSVFQSACGACVRGRKLAPRYFTRSVVRFFEVASWVPDISLDLWCVYEVAS